MAETVTISLLAFARYGDLLGGQRHTLSLAPGATVRAALEAVRRLPGGEGLPHQLVVAVNATQTGVDHPLAEGDEMALLPPLAGG